MFSTKHTKTGAKIQTIGTFYNKKKFKKIV